MISSLNGGALLVVTAVEPERQAVLRGLDDPDPRTVQVVAGGVGPVSAAATTANLLARAGAAGRQYRGVVCAGIAGGFAQRAAVGDVVLATRSVAADLGAESPDGFLPLDELGFGAAEQATEPGLFRLLSPIAGAVLTVSTVTGTQATADELADRYPDAVAEAMEGYGVAVAAAAAGLPFAEVRTISNPVGPRDRAGWRLTEAFAALTAAFAEWATLSRTGPA